MDYNSNAKVRPEACSPFKAKREASTRVRYTIIKQNKNIQSKYQLHAPKVRLKLEACRHGIGDLGFLFPTERVDEWADQVPKLPRHFNQVLGEAVVRLAARWGIWPDSQNSVPTRNSQNGSIHQFDFEVIICHPLFHQYSELIIQCHSVIRFNPSYCGWFDVSNQFSA